MEGSLCEYCVQISFDPKKLNSLIGSEREESTFHLGPRSRIESSRCQFCQLVKQACYERDKQGIAPGGRNAFSVPGDSWIIFATLDDSSPVEGEISNLFYLKPTTKSVLDITQIRGWISRCQDKHSDTCLTQSPKTIAEGFPGLEVLRFIDVGSRCIVEMQELPRYVALSYVWGSVSNFRLTKINRNKLLAPGSLNQIWNMLPRTIQDAIILIEKLGTQYLWIDSLCLLQNDIMDLDRGVNVMDLIYERAWVTVVASYGHDANAGLPGVQSGSRTASYNVVQIKPGISLGMIIGLDQIIKVSVYNSRAWTFQEQVLSRRVLYFTGTNIFFRCRREEFIECCVDSHSVPPTYLVGANNGSLLPEAILMTEPLFDYNVMLFYYTARTLTNQGDTLRAMAGIIRRFTEVMKCRFLEGIPTALFDIFILFQGSLLYRRPLFPSYSWAGWRGGIDFEMDDFYSTANDWLRDRTWIIWYRRSVSGATSLVWNASENELFPSTDLDYKGYRQRYPFSFRRLVPKQMNTMHTIPTQDVQFGRPSPTYPMLQFWTLAVYYALVDIDEFKGTGYVVDRNQNICGMVWLDNFEESVSFQQPEPFNVILLSEASEFSLSKYLKDRGGKHYPKANTLQWRYYNILLLEWQDGIAERRGIGRIFHGAIENSFDPGPIWKEIFLA
ncbi:heterokaryon incompatibility protein-domain-containing protein [Xylogone sp. PMI_703]|nr:heterokaryon incompatibility protein-domain-containing protein [Xylogone sp. PMI_703]